MLLVLIPVEFALNYSNVHGFVNFIVNIAVMIPLGILRSKIPEKTFDNHAAQASLIQFTLFVSAQLVVKCFPAFHGSSFDTTQRLSTANCQ
jgi:hypothetical protein